MNENQALYQVWPYYTIAVLASSAIFAAAIRFVTRTRKTVFQYLHEEVQKSDDLHERHLPDLLTQLEREELLEEDLGFELPHSLIVRLQYADILAASWYIWVPAVFGTLLTAAHFLAPW